MRARALCSLGFLLSLLLGADASRARVPCVDYATYLHHVASHVIVGQVEEYVGYSQLVVKGRKAYAWEFRRYGSVLGALQILDLIDPAMPTARGRLAYPTGVEATGLVALDHYVLLATGVVRVVDVDDHDAPEQVLSLYPDGDAVDLAVQARLVYLGLGGAAHAVSVWDFDNPLAPVLLATVPLAGEVHSLLAYGDLLLVGCTDSLEVFSLGNPATPVWLGSLGLAGEVTDIAAAGNLALVEHEGDASLVNLAVPAAPELLAGPLPDDGLDVTSVALHGGVAWLGCLLGDETGFLLRLDLTEPSAPLRIGRDTLPAGPAALAFALDHLYAAEVDVSSSFLTLGRLDVFADGDPASARAGFLDLAEYDAHFSDSAQVGDWLYGIGDLHLTSVSVADPTAPSIGSVQWIGLAGGREALAVGEHLVVKQHSGWPYQYGLQAFDLDDPVVPEARDVLEFAEDSFRATPRGDLIYVGGLGDAVGEGIEVYRLDAAGEFVFLGAVWPGEFAAALCFDAAGRGVLWKGGDFLLADFTDPLTPVVLGSFPYDQDENNIPLAWIEDHIYARRDADWPYARWEIVDASDPTAPVVHEPVYLPPGEYFSDITVRGEVVYVAAGTRTYVYDASDPAVPMLTGTLSNPLSSSHSRLHPQPEALVMAGNYGAVVTWPYQCLATAVDDAAAPPLGARLSLSAAPNPFNPRTTLQFSLPATADVTLAVFDLRGRRVRDLASGHFVAGAHAVVWDGRDLRGQDAADGLYLARLEFAGRSVTARLMLVR